MTTASKRCKRPVLRLLSNERTTKIHNHNQIYDLIEDHDFIAPNEICANAIGLPSILFNRNIIDTSFSRLYQQSLQFGWEFIFTQERQKLKPNDNSVLKSFVLNRLLYECSKNVDSFTKQVKALYDEIHSRMARRFPAWTPENFCDAVRQWNDMQCRRRLFYYDYHEPQLLCGVLMLQKASTNWCHCLIKHCQQNKNFWETDGRTHFREHFQHSFIIIGQPTGPDNVPVTQYIKTALGHAARLNCRIICLFDPEILKDYIELLPIDVTLYPLHREANNKTEKQPPIVWETRQVMSNEGVPVSIYVADLNTLELGSFDCIYKRLSFNSTLCQLEFRIKVKVKHPAYEDTILLTTEPFGICSHGQYFPKFIAQLFTYEMHRILSSSNEPITTDLMAEFICRYFKRIVGIEPIDYTKQFFREIFVKALEESKRSSTPNILDTLYEEILAKIICQIHFMILNPVLSLMYYDSLFLGICDSNEVDEMLKGTQQQPHLLLRFNNIDHHHWNTNPTVNFIIHDGCLRKASFDMKTFANELCRFICESINNTAKPGIIFSTTSIRTFADFRWYFHNELLRLNKMTSITNDTHDPLLPILWMTMRQNDDNNSTKMKIDSNNTIPKAKRRRSNSSSFIESVSTTSPPTTISIVLNLDSRDEISNDSNNLSPKSSCSGVAESASSSSSMTTSDEACQSNNHNNSPTTRQFLIEVPSTIDISPAVLFRHLSEKLANSLNDKNDDTSFNYLIRSNQSQSSLSNIISVQDISINTSQLVDRSSDLCSSRDKMPKSQLSTLANYIPDNPSSLSNIKQEPEDVDCII